MSHLPARTLFYNRRILPVLRPYGRRLQHRLDDWLTVLTARQPASGFDRAAASALFRARLALLYNLEGRSGVVQHWQGAEIETGQPLRVAFVGDTQSVKVLSPRYLQHLLFRPGEFSAAAAGELAMSRAPARAKELAGQADLVIAEVNDLLRWWPEDWAPGDWRQENRQSTTAVHWLWMPTWVRMVLDFPPGQTCDDLENTVMHSQKKNIRLARRSGFSFDISRSMDDFEFFYEHMHVPMMRGRHADYGVVDKKEEMQHLFEQGFLIKLCKDDWAVAGALMHIHGRSVFGIANGILNGSEYWYEQGAVSALYEFMIRWCCENGYARLDAGGARPFASDGLFTFKSRWGLQPLPDVWLGRSWLFWAPGGSPLAVRWLRAHLPAAVEGVQLGAGLQF